MSHSLEWRKPYTIAVNPSSDAIVIAGSVPRVRPPGSTSPATRNNGSDRTGSQWRTFSQNHVGRSICGFTDESCPYSGR